MEGKKFARLDSISETEEERQVGVHLCVANERTVVTVYPEELPSEWRDNQSSCVASPKRLGAELLTPAGRRATLVTTRETPHGSYEFSFIVNRPGDYRLFVEHHGRAVSEYPLTIRCVSRKQYSRLFCPVHGKDCMSMLKYPNDSMNGGRGSTCVSPNSSTHTSQQFVDDDLLLKIGCKGRGNGEFMNPQGLFCSDKSVLVVADSGSQCVQCFGLDGLCQLVIRARGRSPGCIERPTGVTVLANDHLVIADYEIKCVSVFDQCGKFVARFRSDKLLGPKGVAVDRKGNLFVVDNKSNSVFVVDPAKMKTVKRFGCSGPRSQQMAGPHYIAFDSHGRCLISNFHHHCVKVFDADGQYVTAFGSSGQGNGQFNSPTGLAIDSSDNVYVADWGNNRVQVFDINGSFISSINSACDPLYGPQGVTLTPEKHIAVADSGNHCVKLYSCIL